MSSIKNNSTGIFDQSSDFHRSIAMSDAMYGDFSSVGALYAVTGKPILTQNCEMDYSIDKSTLEEYLHSDVISFGQRLLSIDEFKLLYPEWYEMWLPNRMVSQTKYLLIVDYEFGISSFVNAVYKVDEENGKAEYFMSFPGDITEVYLYHAPIRIQNKLVFVPCRARSWAFFDIDLSTWTFEQVPKELYPTVEWRSIFNWWTLFDSEIIVMPSESGAIAKYNIDTGKITYHQEWFSKLSNKIENFDWGIVTGVLHKSNSFSLLTNQTNSILEIDKNSMNVINETYIGADNSGYRTVCQIPHTDIVYLLKYRKPINTDMQTKGQNADWNETILKWNIKTGEIREFAELPINLITGSTQNALNGFLFFNGQLFATPLQGDAILKINIETDEITRVDLKPALDFFERKSSYYKNWAKDQALPSIIFNGKRMTYMAQLPYDYSIVDIDFVTGEITNRRKWYIEGIEDLYRAKHTKEKNSNLPVVENEFMTLENFLDQLETDKLICERKEQSTRSLGDLINADGTAGQAIFNYIKNLAGV